MVMGKLDDKQQMDLNEMLRPNPFVIEHHVARRGQKQVNKHFEGETGFPSKSSRTSVIMNTTQGGWILLNDEAFETLFYIG